MFFKLLFAVRMTHVTSFALPIHSNQHSQHPENSKNHKLGNKTEGDAEDSTV